MECSAYFTYRKKLVIFRGVPVKKNHPVLPMKWSEYFPHRLLQVKLLKCEVELMPKDRRKEALKLRKYQLERLWPFYLPGVVNVTNV